MKQIKTLAIALMAIFALTSLAAAAASAATLPNILPEGTVAKPVTATTKTGASTFGNSILSLKSSGGPGSQTGNGPGIGKLGLFLTVFQNVENTLTSVKCTGLSDR